MRISRVYTRTGDGGRTSLVGGRSADKDDPRIAAYGDVDELNSVLGSARAFNRASAAPAAEVERIEAILRQVQNDLFHVGADLATHPDDRPDGMFRVGDADVQRLERWCDELNEALGPLREFILPGGGVVGATLHQARTVCRRAERAVVTLHRAGGDAAGCLRYLNRLSDLLFVLAREAARVAGEPETFWEKRT